MAPRLRNPLVPRHGLLLQVLGIARISGDKQDERSLEDQEALYRGWLDDFCDTPYQLTMIAGEGSGERLDRDEWALAAQEVETCRYDLVFCEDLGRIVRRIHAFLFCELAEDHDTRVIALNDHVDTADENWRVCAVFASLRHEMHNEDTSKRIRRTLRNRFTNGGVVQFPIYGYIKPPGSSSDAELTKDSAATPILERWFTMLEEGASFAEVADMLNSLGVKPGQFCRKDTWDGYMVARVTRNPILKGYRIRNKFMTKRENRTGRRKSIKAPPGELLVRICPHLQHIEPERWDRLIEMLKQRNGACRRRLVEGRDPRAQVPKKRTRFPGQTVFCGVCGRMYIFGGHHEVAYRVIDCNKVVLRAKFRLRLSRLLDKSKAQALLAPQLDSVIEVDLFGKPQRVVHRQKIMELRREMTEAEAAARCNITKTAAQYAARLQRMMDRLQISDPYVPVTEPPAGSGKLRRHLHPRYKFEPLPNAGEL